MILKTVTGLILSFGLAIAVWFLRAWLERHLEERDA